MYVPDVGASVTYMGRKILNYTTKKSPGWTEISYLNTFEHLGMFNKRDFLLGWVISIIKNQLCFAMEISIRGKRGWKGRF